MMKKILINLLILIIFLSCDRKQENEYNKKLSSFDAEIINHFPKKPTDLYTLSVFADVNKDVVSILLLNKYGNNYNHIKDSLQKLSKAHYIASDSCLLVVNMYSNEKNYFSSFKTNDTSYLNKNCLKNRLPIPNFWSLDYKSKNITKLPKDYHILVFDASHNNIDKKYLSHNVYMPSYWKHGYSKGVAMNDKTREIIYWFVLW